MKLFWSWQARATTPIQAGRQLLQPAEGGVGLVMAVTGERSKGEHSPAGLHAAYGIRRTAGAMDCWSATTMPSK
jgi:hypothetical protein